jgi:hypothetical protein
MNRQWKNVCQGSEDNEATVSELSSNTKYVFKCRRLGWSTWSTEVVIRSGPGVPTAPVGLNAREIASNSIVITWGVAEKDNGLPVLDYTLRIKSYKAQYFSVVYRGREKVFVPSGLTPNTVYIFEVCANNRAGEGAVVFIVVVRLYITKVFFKNRKTYIFQNRVT